MGEEKGHLKKFCAGQAPLLGSLEVLELFSSLVASGAGAAVPHPTTLFFEIQINTLHYR